MCAWQLKSYQNWQHSYRKQQIIHLVFLELFSHLIILICLVGVSHQPPCSAKLKFAVIKHMHENSNYWCTAGAPRNIAVTLGHVVTRAFIFSLKTPPIATNSDLIDFVTHYFINPSNIMIFYPRAPWGSVVHEYHFTPSPSENIDGGSGQFAPWTLRKSY